MTKAQSSISKFGGAANVAFAGAAIGVAAFGVASVKAAADAQRVMAQTQAVLKSTGGAANVTAEEIVGLAERLRDLTGADDEAIQASSNLLLTFRDVKNEVGAGNDIFNQAQVAIVDMATALNEGAVPATEDLHSATLQLGKALNDPLTGLTALRRAGVSFSASQVEVIKRLTESGNLMKAQKLILAELSKEFGGAGRAAGSTFAGQLSILKSQVEDVFEAVGKSLLPILQNLVGVLQRTLVPALGFVADHLGEVSILLTGYAAYKFVPLLLDAIGAAAGRAAVLLANLEVSVIGAATALGTLAKLIPLAALGLGGYKEDVSDSIPLVHDFTHALDDEKQKAALAAAGINNLSGAVGGIPSDYNPAISSVHKLNDALRTQLDLTLSIADPTFALVQAVRDNKTAEHELAAAHREVNRLQEEGKKGTDAYREARQRLGDAGLGAAESEAAVAAAVRSLDQALEDGKSKRKDVIQALETIGKQAGLTGSDIQKLKDDVRSGLTAAAALAKQLAPEVGRALSTGIANGITTSSELISVSAANAVHNAIAAARRAAKAESPSKRMMELGRDLMEGLKDGIGDKDREVVQKIIDTIGKMLDAAKTALGEFRSKMQGFAGGISGGFSSFADLVGGFGAAQESGGDVQSLLASQLGGAQNFADILKTLQTQGASKALLSQIAGAGPEGIPFAQALLQGGPALVQQASQQLEAINRIADHTGKTLSQEFFGEQMERLRNRVDRVGDLLAEANRLQSGKGGDVVLQIDGQTFARITRDQLNKLADRNVTAGVR